VPAQLTDPANRDPRLTCKSQTATGAPCRAFARTGQDTCLAHSAPGAMATIGRLGADVTNAKGRLAAMEPLQLNTPDEIHAVVVDALNRVRLGQMHPNIAHMVNQLAKTALAALEAKEAERLEAILAARQAQQPHTFRRRR